MPRRAASVVPQRPRGAGLDPDSHRPVCAPLRAAQRRRSVPVILDVQAQARERLGEQMADALWHGLEADR